MFFKAFNPSSNLINNIDDFKEKIDRDHYVDKEGGKVDHNHPIIPARTSALTEVEGL